MNSGGTSHILPAERKRATFDVLKMTHVLDGGKANTARRHFIASPLTEGDGAWHHMDPHEVLNHSVEKFINVHKEFAKQDFKPTRDDIGYMAESS